MEMKSEHLQDVFGLFEGKIVCADDWIGERGWGARETVGGVNEGARPVIEPGRGKPCPDLFLLASREALGRKVGSGEGEAVSEEEGVERAKGLVFEDAIPGVHAGKRAGMNGE
jgi:pseudouridine-5'-monophosphatase